MLWMSGVIPEQCGCYVQITGDGMVVLFFLLLSILMAGLFGGAIYVLVEKIRLIRRLEQELDECREKLAPAEQIERDAGRIIQEAKDRADAISLEGREQEERQTRVLEELGEKQREQRAVTEELAERERSLRKTLAGLSEEIKLCDLNFYTPHYDFERALDYERALSHNRDEQKKLIQAGRAVIAEPTGRCDKKLGKLLVRLLIRAFNSECDLLVEKVDYKNIVIFENRLNNSFTQLNKLTLHYDVMITPEFLNLKLAELRIHHEFQEKKQAEAEEQRQIREIMREEIRAEREMEKAKAEAEKEEQKYQALLDKMMEAARKAQGAELDRMNAQIAVLQQQLEEAKAKERAISQAQLTRAGYVYVISNVGSFGENVFKIGMTRRLEPQERVNELGDASVPFQFDVHAMIYHENAPELENKLHQIFDANRVNKINLRKEFFRVPLEEIEKAARQYKADVTFTRIAEAKEYRQSLALEQERGRTA